MDIERKVAKRITQILRQRKLTQERLAYEIDMSKGYLSNFLSGKRGIRLGSLQRIAEGLQVDIKDLIP